MEWNEANILPKKDTIVLGFLDDGTQAEVIFYDNYNRSGWKIKDSNGLFWVSWVRTVKKWMPLPEPPKE